jgi:hypothetical protein
VAPLYRPQSPDPPPLLFVARPISAIRISMSGSLAQRHHGPLQHRVGLALRGGPDPRSVSFGTALHPFAGEFEPGQLGQVPLPVGEGFLDTHSGQNPAQPAAQGSVGDAQLLVFEGKPVAALGTM